MKLNRKLLLILFFVSSVNAEVSDRVLAVIGERPNVRIVTISDIELEKRLSNYISCPVKVLCYEKDYFNRLIDRTILRGLAGESATYKPDPMALEERLRDLEISLNSDGISLQTFLDEFAMTKDELAGAIYSRMVVENYVQRNVGLQILAANGNDADYLEYYQIWMEDIRSRSLVRITEELQK